MLLLAVMPLLTMSCSKEDGDVENPLLSGNYEYSGTMTVTADGIDNVSEEVKVEVRIDETAKTLDRCVFFPFCDCGLKEYQSASFCPS